MQTLGLAICFWMLLCAYVSRKRCDLLQFDREATIPLRGLLIVLIMAAHLTLEGVNLMTYFMWQNAAVAVFFFMSGYGYMKSAMRSRMYLDGLVWRTAKKLFVPLLAVMVVGAGSFVMYNGMDFQKLLRLYVAGETPLSPHAWFVLVLFLLAVCFSVTAKWCTGWKLIGLNFFFVTGFFLLFQSLNWARWWWLSLHAFPIGMSFAYEESEFRNLIRHHVGIYAVASGIFAIIAVVHRCVGGNLIEGVMRALIGPIVAMGFYVIPIPRRCRFLSFLCGISFELYLTHGFVRVWVMHGLSGDVIRIVAGFASLVLSIPAAMVLKKITHSLKWYNSH